MLCAIWYHLYNFKNVKSTHGGVLLLVKLQASACNYTKSNTPLWVFFTFLKLYKWYQIVQRVTYKDANVQCNIGSSSCKDIRITYGSKSDESDG